MNNEGVAGTQPVNDDTGDRTFTYSFPVLPVVVVSPVPATGFGAGSFGELTGSSGSPASSVTEFTTDLNGQGKDWCIEFMNYHRRNNRPDKTVDQLTLITDPGGGDTQQVIIQTHGAADSGSPSTPSVNHVFSFSFRSFNPTQIFTLDTETILGTSGRYPNGSWSHAACIRKESNDGFYFYVDGVLQFSDIGNGAGRMNGDQDEFQFRESFTQAGASNLHDSVRIVIGSTVYGTGASFTPPSSSVGEF